MHRMGLLITGALALSTVFFAYRAFDTGVTLTYHEAEIDNLRETNEMLAHIAVTLANVPTNTEVDVELVIRKDFGHQLVQREGDTLFVDQIGLRFAGGKLVEIRLIDGAPSRGSGAPRKDAAEERR
jgi:hypothetical protein